VPWRARTHVQFNGARRAGRPRLMREPLGSAHMFVRSQRLLLLLTLMSCTGSDQRSVQLPTLHPTPARSTRDSVIATVLRQVVLRGLPIYQAARPIVIRDDSGVISSSSLPRMDSIDFVVLDSARIQELANEKGQLNVLRVWTPVIGGDTARSGASNRFVWRRGPTPPQAVRHQIVSACTYRLRRADGAWQVIDSVLSCVVS
jgi:hypothetical protein